MVFKALEYAFRAILRDLLFLIGVDESEIPTSSVITAVKI